ncbi:hypothetical protein [Corynebacterium heidelbergense]|uniref:Uncharacterized protein n=1 Tax=Corynebacterium heidelbergense TaxID=2055947 RepID=A0A364VE16_9CORY|nr:hypothetical protein [Corynebacterium heidelbergense]RAV34889.1 hypothetical protein CWC39_00690 [Corynebacterium heidelbergense]WCZ36025.1 hypothetical protein CHEID_02290 [Corynebacterium heidelbergense]
MSDDDTLLGMSPEEREQCVGMRAIVPGTGLCAVILRILDDDGVELQFPEERNARLYYPHCEVIPDFSVPRAWMPDGSPPDAHVVRRLVSKPEVEP